MSNLYKQRESNVLWIKYVYGTLLECMSKYQRVLFDIEYFTKDLGYRRSDIASNELERMFNTDILLYCYMIASLDGSLNREKNKIICEMFPFAYDYRTAKKETKGMDFREMSEKFFPASLRGVIKVNSMLVSYHLDEGKDIDIKSDFSVSRTYFRLLNMILDTLGCYDGKKRNLVFQTITDCLDKINEISLSNYGYGPNEKEYETYYYTQDDILAFKPLWE